MYQLQLRLSFNITLKNTFSMTHDTWYINKDIHSDMTRLVYCVIVAVFGDWPMRVVAWPVTVVIMQIQCAVPFFALWPFKWAHVCWIIQCFLFLFELVFDVSLLSSFSADYQHNNDHEDHYDYNYPTKNTADYGSCGSGCTAIGSCVAWTS